jgi:hypothetical protein
MVKVKTYYRSRIALLILFCTMLFSEIFADSSCGTFVVKVTYYTNSDRQDSGYILFNHYRDGAMVFNFIDEYYNIIHRVQPNQIDYSKIKGCHSTSYEKILAVNRSVMTDTNISQDFNGDFDLKALSVTDRICELNYFDTINYTDYTISKKYESSYSLDSTINPYNDIIHYAKAEYLNLDTIKLIILDSILWCGDNDQIQFLNTIQIKKILSKDVIVHFRVADSDAQQFAIDFYCLDPKWTKSRILSLLDLARIDNNFSENGGDNIFDDFPLILQRAIQLDKVLFFVRRSP